MFALTVTVCEILTVEIYMTASLTFRTAKVKCKYANGKAVCDFIFVGNIEMFAVSVTICEKFLIKVCMTLTFRMGQCQLQIFNWKGLIRLSICWQ